MAIPKVADTNYTFDRLSRARMEADQSISGACNDMWITRRTWNNWSKGSAPKGPFLLVAANYIQCHLGLLVIKSGGADEKPQGPDKTRRGKKKGLRKR